MKGFGGNKVLGLAVGERGVLACELSRAGRGYRADRMAEFVYPPSVSADDPASLGPALREFLKGQRFAARRTVVGLPLKWAVVKTKEVPPASPAALAGLLRLQAERDFAMEPQDLAVEYVGQANPSAPGSVLLVAVPRKRMNAVIAAAEAAGLNVGAVTLTAAALGAETGRFTGGEGAVLHVSGGTAELTLQHQGQPRVLRHLRAPVGAASTPAAPAAAGPASTVADIGETAPPVGDAAGGTEGEGAAPFATPRPRDVAPPTALTVELRQVLSLMPQNGTAGHLNLWDGVGLGDAPQRWGESLGVVVREHSLSAMGVDPAANGADAGSGRFAPAVALALAGLRAEPVVPDLLHSRLVVREPSRFAKPVVWGIVLGATLLLAVVAAWWEMAYQRGQVAQMKKSLQEMQEPVKLAETTIARLAFTQRWTGTDPRFLSVLRDLAGVFPGDGQAWATRVNVQEDGRVTLIGRASGKSAEQPTLERLRATGKFTELKVIDVRPVGPRSSDVEFQVSFRAIAADPAGGAGAAGTATRPTTAPASASTQRVERARERRRDRDANRNGDGEPRR